MTIRFNSYTVSPSEPSEEQQGAAKLMQTVRITDTAKYDLTSCNTTRWQFQSEFEFVGAILAHPQVIDDTLVTAQAESSENHSPFGSIIATLCNKLWEHQPAIGGLS